MGIARGMIKLLMREGNRKFFCGKILTAGKQDVYATEDDLQRWAREMGFQLKPAVEMSLSDKKEFKEKRFITATALFQSLGFDAIDSMDYSDFEGCTIMHDLNKDVSDALHDKYDLIFDGGTSEHIFNLPKVFENYNKMLKVGGRMIHSSPSSNYTDHGFYMFSPTLFYDYYSANKWNIIDSFFIKHSLRPDKHLWSIYNYTPDCLDRLAVGGLSRGVYAIFFNAQKTAISTFDASVQQGYCTRAWDRTGPACKEDLMVKMIKEYLPYWLRQFLYSSIYMKLPLGVHLKLVARY